MLCVVKTNVVSTHHSSASARPYICPCMCSYTGSSRDIETGTWKLQTGFGQILPLCFRNTLAGCAEDLFNRNYRPLLEETGWVSDFINVCLETRWLGQKPSFLLPGMTLYIHMYMYTCIYTHCTLRLRNRTNRPATLTPEPAANTHAQPPPLPPASKFPPAS